MLAEKLVESRLQHFRKQLRNQQLKFRHQQQRQTMLQTSSLPYLVPKLSFPKHNPQPSIICKVLKQSKQMLLQTFKTEFLNQSESQAQRTVEMHIAFWQQFLFWLQQNKQSCSMLVPIVTNFIVEFIERYSWKQCSIYTHFLSLFVDLVQNFFSQFSDPTRKHIAEWIYDAKYIALIQRLFCSTQEFLAPNLFPNIYQMIEQALSSQIPSQQQSAANFLLQVSKYANSTQNYLIYKHKNNLFPKLLQLLQSNCNSIEATFFWPPIYYSLNTYTQSLKEYCNSSLIDACRKMLNSKIEDNIFGGLAIIKVLSRGQEEILQILKKNLDCSQQNWLSVCLQQNLYDHSKIDISKLFLQILKNLLFWFKKTDVLSLCSFFQKKGKSIMVIIESIWETSRRDEETVNITLQCVLALILIDDIITFEQQPTDVFLQSRNMLPFISKCELSQNNQIRQNATCIMDQMHIMGKNKDSL